MSSNSSGEGNIRKEMIEGDVVEVMISLPSQLFLNTQRKVTELLLLQLLVLN